MANYSRLLIFAIISGIHICCNSQLPPDERCIQAGALVCIDCFSVGECRVNSSWPSGFGVVETSICISGEFCDLSIEEGGCVALNPTLTDCGCSDDSCRLDPNDPNKYLNCDQTPGQSSGPCDGDVNLVTCSCYSDILSTTVSTSTSTDTKTTILPSGNSPAERCNAENDVVCIDCFTVGTCVPDPSGGFFVYETESCKSDAFCDRTIADGECVPLNPAITDCGCSNTSCLIDPNDSSRFINCSDIPGESQQCNGTISLLTCTCGPSTTSPSTYTSITSTPMPSYTTYISYASTTSTSLLTDTSTPSLSSTTYTSPASYASTTRTYTPPLSDTSNPRTSTYATSTSDEATTGASATTEISSTSSYKTDTTSTDSTYTPTTTDKTDTTSTASTYTTTTTDKTDTTSTVTTYNPTTTGCPECGLIPDNNPNTCSGYIICGNGDHAHCPGNSCFDPDSCHCVAG